MNPIFLLITAVAFYLLASLIALCGGRKRESEYLAFSCSASAIAGVLGVLSAMQILFSEQTLISKMASPFYFADFVIKIDAFNAFMLLVISLLVIAVSIYAVHYLREYLNKGAWAINFFLNLFVASMVMLVVSDNAFYFIVFFEMMSLASYFLVLIEQSEKSVKAGLQYFFIAHTGSVLIMVAFFILYRASGSLNFSDFTNLDLPAWQASTIFLLGFFGFAAKAGMITLHGWLPLAHPAAPSHASALMSGVMVKIGIFGIIKMGLVFLAGAEAWWGYLVLFFGAISSVLGVMYALAEHDIKRLLAYHTVENVGIILMGVGVAMIGMASNNSTFAILGLLGALYHLLNHAIFKGLLFLGAGSIIYRTHTKDMEKMGGLAKLMPFTATTFLIGSMAICALPPLNGFVSEWFIYQSLFNMTQQSNITMVIFGATAIIMLAITGALACMCFVKVYGICFSGMPKSEQASKAKEVTWPMITACALLATLCIIFGVGSPWISPLVSNVATQTLNIRSVTIATGLSLHPISTTQAILSTPIIAMGLLVLLLVPALILALSKEKTHMQNRHQGSPWTCGYRFEKEMTVSASGITQPVRHMFAPLYQLRKQLDPSDWMAKSLVITIKASAKIEPMFDRYLIAPISSAILKLSDRVSKLQSGNFRIYCLYIVITLAALLCFSFSQGM